MGAGTIAARARPSTGAAGEKFRDAGAAAIDEARTRRNHGGMKRIVLALFLALALPAAAQDRPRLTFDQDKIEWALPWAQSSPCLGDTSDALCLAATVVVCGVLHERRECRSERTYQKHHNHVGGHRVAYQIWSAGYVPDHRLEYLEDIVIAAPNVLRLAQRRQRPIVAQILIWQRICDPHHPPCVSDRETGIIVHLEWRGGRWVYLTAGIYSTGDWISD
jgi:hypothetical protein